MIVISLKWNFNDFFLASEANNVFIGMHAVNAIVTKIPVGFVYLLLMAPYSKHPLFEISKRN